LVPTMTVELTAPNPAYYSACQIGQILHRSASVSKNLVHLHLSTSQMREQTVRTARVF
jgi:hypothetical protein